MTYKTDEDIREKFELWINNHYHQYGNYPEIQKIFEYFIAQRHADHQAIVEMGRELKEEARIGEGWTQDGTKMQKRIDDFLASLSHLEDKQKTQ